MINEQKLLELKKQIEEAERLASEYTGQLKSLYQRMKEEFECNSLEELEFKISEEEKQIKQLEEEIEQLSKELEKFETI